MLRTSRTLPILKINSVVRCAREGYGRHICQFHTLSSFCPLQDDMIDYPNADISSVKLAYKSGLILSSRTFWQPTLITMPIILCAIYKYLRTYHKWLRICTHRNIHARLAGQQCKIDLSKFLLSKLL